MAEKLRDKRAEGGTVKYTAQYFDGARFVAVNPKLTRNSNCYTGIGTPRLYVSTPRGEKERFAGITEGRSAIAIAMLASLSVTAARL